jgi:hypothetical protein
MEFPMLIAGLSTKLRIAPLVLDSPHVLSVVIDEMLLQLSLVDNETAVSIDAVLTEIDRQDTALLKDLLSANLIGQGTGGAVLSINEEQQIHLSLRLQLETLTLQHFIETLERFINYLEFWRMRISTPKKSILPTMMPMSFRLA